VRKNYEECGFSLIELMMVILIIAILMAVAVPGFLTVQRRAQDEHARTTLSNAAKVVFVEFVADGHFEDVGNPGAQARYDNAEARYTWVDGDTDSDSPTTVSVDTEDSGERTMVVLAARSKSRRCFYLRLDLKSVEARAVSTASDRAVCRSHDFLIPNGVTAGWP
jgi:type IV pilus assembly protein PilA